MEHLNWNLIWLAPSLPLAGFVFHALFGKRAGRAVVAWIATLVVFGSFAISSAVLAALLKLPEAERNIQLTLFQWIDVGSLQIPFSFRIDPLSMLMCLIVTGVGGLIHLYATGYMADDSDHSRFFTYFNLFIVFMLTLVLANNLPIMFIGWEGVGLCSYLLIGFWYKDIANAKCGNKAFIVNRIGDAGFLLAMFLAYTVLTKHGLSGDLLSFESLSANLSLFQEEGALTTIGLLLFLGACGKSAQLPLYFWLPDAMAGPTPVSALIHAATMVTAGLALVSRCHFLFEPAVGSDASLVVAITGAATALFASTIAFGQTDIKKVLAYSTVSQLGYMFLACGVGAFSAGMFHVTTHAFFKALLFLASGSVIMAMHHQQDMRQYGGLWKILKITFATTFIGWLAISGVMPFAGYWSKDEILLSVRVSDAPQALYWTGIATAALTSFYMTRLMGLTFWGLPRHAKSHAEESGEHGESAEAHAHHSAPKEPGWSVLSVLMILALLSAVGGWLLAKPYSLEKFLAPSLNQIASVKAEEPEAVGHHAAEAEPSQVAGMEHGSIEELKHKHHNEVANTASAAGIIGILLGLAIYLRRFPAFEEKTTGLFGLQRAAGAQWGYDWLFSHFIALKVGERIASLCSWFDNTVIDGAVNGIARVFGSAGNILRRTESGNVRSYALGMFFGVVILIGIVYYIAVMK